MGKKPRQGGRLSGASSFSQHPFLSADLEGLDLRPDLVEFTHDQFGGCQRFVWIVLDVVNAGQL